MAKVFRMFRGHCTSSTPPVTIIVPQAGAANTLGETRAASTVAEVHGLTFCNIDGASAVNVYASVYNGTTEHYILSAVPVPAGSSYIFDKTISLESLDRLRVWSDFAGDLDCTAATLLFTI